MAQMKRLDALNATQKTSALCKVLILKKIKKNCQNCTIFWKCALLAVFLDFFRISTLQRAEVFCVAFSASRRFIWAIKKKYLMIFIFHFCKGGPLLGQFLKKTAHRPKIHRNSKTKTFLGLLEQKECSDRW